MSSRDYGVFTDAVVGLDSHKGNIKSVEEKANELFQGLDAELPKMPGELDLIAKNHWVYIGSRLKKAGLISSVDLSVFRVYCETYAWYVKAQREVQENGEFQKTPSGYFQLSPWAVARERHASRLHKLESKLNLTPHSRQSLRIENPNQGSLDLDG
jgi:P27 family predicted phage terminase small subunit